MDPVKSCELYREFGCSHVDGYLCDGIDCTLRKKFLEWRNSQEDLDPTMKKILNENLWDLYEK
jgi:hypothetical protein